METKNKVMLFNSNLAQFQSVNFKTAKNILLI